LKYEASPLAQRHDIVEFGNLGHCRIPKKPCFG
jgi:hypothetical protein